MKGYAIALADGSQFYIPGAEHIERVDELGIYDDDKKASRAAERDGIKLIYGMEGVPDGVYVDTPENRKVIQEGLAKWPEYRKVAEEYNKGLKEGEK